MTSDEDHLKTQLNVISEILKPYKGNHLADGLPGALMYAITVGQYVSRLREDSEEKKKLLNNLDSLTAAVGELGEIVSESDFQVIKDSYLEIQFHVSTMRKTGEIK